jgi:hypothetical protein
VQVNVVVVIRTKRKIGQLQHSEKFQPHYFAAKQGHEKEDIADDLHGREEVGDIFLCSTVTLCVIDWRHHGLISQHKLK